MIFVNLGGATRAVRSVLLGGGIESRFTLVNGERVFLSSESFSNNPLSVVLGAGFAPAPGQQFTLIDDRFIGPITGTFRDLPEGARFFEGGYEFAITYAGDDGNDVVLTAVPEPGAAGAVAGMLAAWLLRRARRRSLAA